MAVQYRLNVKWKADNKLGDWFKPDGLGAVMDRVKDVSKRWEGPYKQRNWGDKDGWGQERTWNEAMKRFRTALGNNEVGDVRAITPNTPKDTFLAVRKVSVIEVDFPSISSNATPRAKAIVKPLWAAFPQLHYLGCYNCRHIAGSSSWSEHSWADAIDIGPPNMAYGDKVYRWLMNNKGRFDITRVLWRVSGHFDHLHIDFDPDHSGTPPCA